MAGQLWTLTKGGETTYVSSPVTRDWLVTQGWTLGTATETENVLAAGLDSGFKTLGEMLLVPNGDFENFTGSNPDGGWGQTYSYGGRTYGPDGTVRRTGGRSFKMDWTGGGGLDLGSPAFRCTPRAWINVEWWERHEANNAILKVLLVTSDGNVQPEYSNYNTKQTSTAWSAAQPAGQWNKHTARLRVAAGHHMGRVHVIADPVSPSLGAIWIDSVKITQEDSLGIDPLDVSDIWDSEAWIAPTLTAPFANYGSTWETAGYKKVAGVVYLRGLLTTSSAPAGGSTIFYLPNGYRPNGDAHVLAATGVSPWSTLVNVMASGQVRINQPIGSGQWLSLANITFPADL